MSANLYRLLFESELLFFQVHNSGKLSCRFAKMAPLGGAFDQPRIAVGWSATSGLECSWRLFDSIRRSKTLLDILRNWAVPRNTAKCSEPTIVVCCDVVCTAAGAQVWRQGYFARFRKRDRVSSLLLIHIGYGCTWWPSSLSDRVWKSLTTFPIYGKCFCLEFSFLPSFFSPAMHLGCGSRQ